MAGAGIPVTLDLAEKEEQQKRHYFLLGELQKAAKELPG